jgi:hypothetical protein
MLTFFVATVGPSQAQQKGDSVERKPLHSTMKDLWNSSMAVKLIPGVNASPGIGASVSGTFDSTNKELSMTLFE